MKSNWTRAELKSLFEEWWASKFERTQITTPSEETEALDTVQSQSGEEGDPDGSMPLLRAEPFGFFGVPMPNEPGLTLTRRGDNGVLFPLGSARYKPKDTKRGESGLYCSKAGTCIHLKQDGEVKIDAASPQKVTVNGGTKSVARVDDTVNCGTLLLTAPMGVLANAQYFPPGALLPSPLPTGAIVVKLNGGKITSGAERFQG